MGKKVFDPNGRSVGRIEEVRAEKHNGEWVIEEYLIGTAAILERSSAWMSALSIVLILGATKIPNNSYRVPWNQLNLTNPECPRLYCILQELQEITEQIEAAQQPQASNSNNKSSD